MSSNQNYLMKKNNILGKNQMKKSIPININSNPAPGKFIFSNHVNKIASSYLSMGRKIQINKNIKTSKIMNVNTNSATNYYTLNSKDTKQTNSSNTNSLINNIKNNNNKSEINSNFYNNFINLNNINNHSLQKAIDLNRVNHITNSKDKKQLSILLNSRVSNELLINGYQTSKNNLNKNIIKHKLNGNNTINNLSKNKYTISTRHNILNSKIKTKKIPMKSKLCHFKFQNRNKKSTSTSLNNVYVSKKHFHRDINSYIKSDLLNIKNDQNLISSKIKSSYNLADVNQNNYEIKSLHYRNNTASFENKDIINIFHKKTLSFKNNNINYNQSNNINKIKNSVNKNNKENISEIYNSAINRWEGSNNSRKKLMKLNNGKKIDAKIFAHENKGVNLKNNKINSNNNKGKKLHNFYYNKYLTNNHLSNMINNNSNIIHHIKNYNSNNINGIKKIIVKPKESNKLNINQNIKINNRPIPTPCQKIKSNIIPSQRSKKINLTKFLKGMKIKPVNKGKSKLNRISSSIKKISKENKSDFSLSQINDILLKNCLENKEEEKKLNDCNSNSNNKINKKEKNKNEKIKEIDNKIKINTNFISNIKINGKEYNNKIKNIKNDKLIENKYNLNLNSYTNNSNNNFLINNKNDYSIDNAPENLGMNFKNMIFHKKKTSNKEIIQNISDINLDNDHFPKTEENNINIKDNNNNEKKLNEDKISSYKQLNDNKKNNELINKEIKNNLFDEENLEDLPEDYDEKFDDLYSIINKIKFGNVLVCAEGLFTPEGNTYRKYKDKFDKFYDKLFNKKKNSFSNSNNKPKKIIEVASNAKTTSSSSKKNIVSPNVIYNDLNIVGLNVNY